MVFLYLDFVNFSFDLMQDKDEEVAFLLSIIIIIIIIIDTFSIALFLVLKDAFQKKVLFYLLIIK